MKKLIISGLRTCERKDAVYAEISKFIAEIGSVDEIITGGSTGVDLLSRQYAEDHHIPHKEFVPNWQDDLNAAGMIRDTRMAEYATHLLVLSNGISKESKNLIAEAKRNNLVVKSVGAFEGLSESDSARSTATPIYI